MPAKSIKQFRLMQGVKHGSIHKRGLSRDTAAEYVSGQSPKGLPERVPGKRQQRDRQAAKGKKAAKRMAKKPPIKAVY